VRVKTNSAGERIAEARSNEQASMAGSERPVSTVDSGGDAAKRANRAWVMAGVKCRIMTVEAGPEAAPPARQKAGPHGGAKQLVGKINENPERPITYISWAHLV
jgi:hypothetical protein